MARGDLGINIMAHFAKNNKAQTVSEIKQALKEITGKDTSGGAIGYALDRLILDGKVVKVPNEKPARYHSVEGTDFTAAAPVAAPAISATSASRPARASRTSATSRAQSAPLDDEQTEDVTPDVKKRKGSSCGYCAANKNMDYHRRHCPEMIPRAAAGRDWYCQCFISDHNQASDFAKYQSERDEAAREAATSDSDNNVSSEDDERMDQDSSE